MSVVKSLVAIAGLGIFSFATPAQGLPGQTVDEVTSWIQGHPTLRPQRGERLIVNKSDTASQRFSFQASLVAPGKIKTGSPNARTIRSESLSLFDMRNGVSQNRLKESLRVIYGVEISQDFDRASVLYAYPSEEKIIEAVRKNDPKLAALQGELRQGRRYAYWLEIAQTPEGLAYSGKVTVFLADDLEKLKTELTNR
jgi:hypothetical protein